MLYGHYKCRASSFFAIYGNFNYLCVVFSHPLGGERGGEDREVWLAVVILGWTLMYICRVVFTPVNPPRVLYVWSTFVQMRLILPIRLIMSICAVIPVIYPCVTIIITIDLYSLSCWNRTSVLSDCFVAFILLELLYVLLEVCIEVLCCLMGLWESWWRG